MVKAAPVGTLKFIALRAKRSAKRIPTPAGHIHVEMQVRSNRVFDASADPRRRSQVSWAGEEAPPTIPAAVLSIRTYETKLTSPAKSSVDLCLKPRFSISALRA